MTAPPLPVAEPSNALPAWQRRTVAATAACLLASGLAWLLVHYGAGDGAGGLPHPLEAWLVRWHGLSAVAGTFAGGLVAAGHVARGWSLGRSRASGLSLCVLGALLVLSGYALWYLVPEAWHAGAGWAHAATGVLAFGLGVLHARSRALPRPPSDAEATPPGGEPRGR
jgi:hypothetical protein